MTVDVERIYNLLPAAHRIRDVEQGEPLKQLLAFVSEQVAVLEENLAQLYDDQFIETCADWVIPYIGDLIGYRSLNTSVPKVASPRAEVANTIGLRRRKGTAAMLEQLARDVTGWNARAVEFFLLLSQTQYMNHIRPKNFGAPDLRHWEPLERLNSAFDSVGHTVDVRRIASGRGRYNIPNVGIFLFRLGSYSLTQSPAFKLDDRRYLFSPLGNNSVLFNHPETETDIAHLAAPQNVPMPISRRVLDAYLNEYYGAQKSLVLNVDRNDADVSSILVCDLSDIAGNRWAHDPPKRKFAIDPVLGRIAFSSAEDPPGEVELTYHFGFSADMGGGEYPRADMFDDVEKTIKNMQSPAGIQDALTNIGNADIVQIGDSRRYEGVLSIVATNGKKIELRARDEFRPTLALTADMTISGDKGSEVTLNGLLIANKSLVIGGSLDRVTLRHCTLVPGLSLSVDGTPRLGDQPGLIVNSPDTTVVMDRCIVGGIRAVEGVHLIITNSIVDATAPANVAFAAPNGNDAGGTLDIQNTTIIGKVHTRELRLASNTIFMSALTHGDTWLAPVWSERRQSGCVRFSYVPLESRVPQRYRCRPTNDADAQRIKPQFTSTRYGDAGYMQLSLRAAREIRAGADDESEMGAFHELFQPQRESNLRTRLDEYLRFGLEAGIIYAT